VGGHLHRGTARRRAQADGFDLEIEVDPNGPVARVMELTGLQDLLLGAPVASS
jgi:hypothetical protein